MLYSKEERKDMLETAINAVQSWSIPPYRLVSNTKRSDQYWVEVFNKNNIKNLKPTDVHNFFKGWGLHRVPWNYEIVASLVKDFVSTNSFDPVKDITNFADKLVEAVQRGSAYPSAASKIANFAFPSSKVYIWDTNAREGIKYLSGDRKSDATYETYYNACDNFLLEEAKKKDFQEAISIIDTYCKSIEGPYSDRNIVPIDFFERRLFDKYLFAVGCLAREKRTKHKNLTNKL